MNKSFKERRNNLRIYRNFILTFHEKGKSTAMHEVSQVNNVSKGGLNFSTTRPLTEGAVVMIDLKTPFITDSIRLTGVVLGCKEKIADMIYEVRLQFQGMPKQVLTMLEKIENYSKANEGQTEPKG